MNFKIQETFPPPTQPITNSNVLVYVSKINCFILYGQQTGSPEVAEQPKKKISFKADKSVPVPASDKISVFSILDQKWSVVQAKGKIPSPRTQFQCLFLGSYLILYGGKVKGKLTNEVFALDCDNWIWKKLFSLDGPPQSEDSMFFKISETSAGLIISGSLWILYLSDVKWQLSANELPGSIWEKTNISLPQRMQICWSLDDSCILLLGKQFAVRVNISKKQKQIQSKHKQTEVFSQIILSHSSMMMYPEDNSLKYSFIMTPCSLFVFEYSKATNDMKISQILDFKLQNLALCSAFKNQNSLYYLDSSSKLILLHIEKQRKISDCTLRQLPQRQMIMNSNSCILEEEENEESSLLQPSSNEVSRVKILGKESQGQEEKEQDNSQNSNIYQSGKNSSTIQIQTYSPLYQDPSSHTNQFHPHFAPNQYSKGGSPNKTIQISQTHGKKGSLLVQGHKVPGSKLKSKTEQYGGLNRKGDNESNLEGSYFVGQEDQSKSDENQLKESLRSLLYNQNMRRNLLQAKVQLFENFILKSQSFVRSLKSYGDEKQQNRHIHVVKNIQSKIETNYSKQMLFKSEIKDNKIPILFQHQIQKSMRHIDY